MTIVIFVGRRMENDMCVATKLFIRVLFSKQMERHF